MIESIAYCVDGDNLSKGFDFDRNESFVKLTLYNQFANLLNTNAQYFAGTGIDIEEVQNVYSTIYDNANSITVSAEVNKQLQNSIITNLNSTNGKYVRALERVYDNAANAAGRGQ